MTKHKLEDTLRYEKEQYFKYMFPTRMRRLMGLIKHEPIMSIWRWQKASRKSDYYHFRVENGGSIFDKIKYIYWISRRNRLGEKLGIELQTENIGKGLFIYHFGGGIVAYGKWGENIHLHGNNCIGNGGPGQHIPPTLGNNVMVGVGAKIIGDVHIADDVKIAAGAVVVKDIPEPGCTVAGVPAKIVKHKYQELQ